MTVAFWNAWDHDFIYFHIYSFPGFTEDWSWLFESTKKKQGAEQNFPFVIPKATTIKMGVYF